MFNKDLQYINDEILSYQQSICALDDKMNFMQFLDSIDNSITGNVNIDYEEVLEEKRKLEKNMRSLLDKKLKLINEQNADQTICKTAHESLNSTKCLSSLCSFMNDFHMQEFKNAKTQV